MRGRPGCPTGQEKQPVGATVSNPPFLQGKVGYQIAPSSAPVCALGHLPPEGKAFAQRSGAGYYGAYQNAFQHISPRKCVPNRS